MSLFDAILAGKLTGGGGSLPKPIPYEYMPEGYPKVETGDRTTVLEEQTITLADWGYGEYGTDLLPFCDFEIGKIYTVVYDGEAYECTAVDGGVVNQNMVGSVIYGNIPEASDVPGCNVEAPFYGTTVDGVHVVASLSADQAGDHTFAIYDMDITVTPIAEKFLPKLPSHKLPDDVAYYDYDGMLARGRYDELVARVPIKFTSISEGFITASRHTSEELRTLIATHHIPVLWVNGDDYFYPLTNYYSSEAIPFVSFDFIDSESGPARTLLRYLKLDLTEEPPKGRVYRANITDLLTWEANGNR